VNLGRMLTSTARHHPDHRAVQWGERSLTYGELDARVDALAAGLTKLGLRRGDRIGFIMWNRPEILEVFYAAFKLGLCAVPLNARITADEIRYHLEDSGAAALVHGPEFVDEVAKAVDGLEGLGHVLSLDGATPREADVEVLEYEDVVEPNLGAPDATVDVDMDDPCWLFYTSGTTGRPKGAMLTHKNMAFLAMGWAADLMPLTPHDVTLHAAPLTHGAGFHALAAVMKGCTHIIPASASFDAGTILALIESEGVTNTWMVPTQINRLVQSGLLDDHDLSSLHSVLYGGAPFHVEDLKTAVRHLGPVLVQVFAQGECAMTVTYLPQDEHVLDGGEVEARLASAGRARSCVEVRVVDDEGGDLPVGERGEILVRGPVVMRGYWNRPEETAEALRDGWLHTGDIGALDEHGYLYVLDRQKDMVISGGNNVYAREVEEVLLQHPAVDAVAVIGLPDRDWGERVVAVVVAAPGSDVDEATVVDHCRANLAAYKKPREVHFVDELPLSAYGKVLKRQLRAELADA
jgi:acyl-CoA synthetase (AMP-forming)/AMP-acid ligase II